MKQHSILKLEFQYSLLVDNKHVLNAQNITVLENKRLYLTEYYWNNVTMLDG